MEDTLHELANQTELRNQNKANSDQNGQQTKKESDNGSFEMNSGSGIPGQFQSSDKVHSDYASQKPLDVQTVDVNLTPKPQRWSQAKN